MTVDYRWFDTKNIEPRFPFGFGLSYASFDYTDVQVQKDFKADSKAVQETAEPFLEYDGSNVRPSPTRNNVLLLTPRCCQSLYDELVTVTVKVTNTGSVTACEVAQLVRCSSHGGLQAQADQRMYAVCGFPCRSRAAPLAVERFQQAATTKTGTDGDRFLYPSSQGRVDLAHCRTKMAAS